MAGIRDRLNMDKDGFELAVNAVAKREQYYHMDAQVGLIVYLDMIPGVTWHCNWLANLTGLLVIFFKHYVSL